MNSGLNPPDKWLSFGLAFVGGFGDAAGFVLVKTFTGHITGSLVLGAIAAAARDWRGTLAHLTATACFLTGIPLSALIARLATAWSSWALLPMTMGIEVILIWGAFVLGAGTGAAAVFHFGERGILASAFILLDIIVRSLTATSRASSTSGGSGSRAIF